jgi:hypothetical protein
MAPENQISLTLEEWNKSHHQVMEWYVDCISNTLYRHTEGVWLQHHTSSVSHMRFRSEGKGCDKPERVTHIVENSERTRYIEVTELKKICEEGTGECDVHFHYETGIGTSGRQLLRHVQILVGDIAALDVPENWDSNESRNLLVTMDGSVVFGAGYHSLVITTLDEKLILSGGNPDDGDPLRMTSYRSELGGLASALAVLGMLERSGILNIRSVKCVSDNQSAVRACKRKPTESIFHRTKNDYDLLATIMNLQAEWCNGINIQYAWVRGHVDSLKRETTREEMTNIKADELCDIIGETATGRHGARPNCGLYLGERCALFIKGTKITSNLKERLIQQLLYGDLRELLIEKEQWNEGTFDNICWNLQKVALKRMSKARQMAIAKLVHNLAFAGARHTQWYGGTK